MSFIKKFHVEKKIKKPTMEEAVISGCYAEKSNGISMVILAKSLVAHQNGFLAKLITSFQTLNIRNIIKRRLSYWERVDLCNSSINFGGNNRMKYGNR